MTHTKAIGQILLYEQIHKYHNTHRDVIQARRYREIIIHIFHKVTLYYGHLQITVLICRLTKGFFRKCRFINLRPSLFENCLKYNL